MLRNKLGFFHRQTLQIVKILSVSTNGPHTRFYISLEHLQLISRGFALYKEMYSQEEFLYARICNLKMTQKCTRGRKKCVLTSKTICFDKFVISIFSRRCISQNCIEGDKVAHSLSLQVLHVFPKGNRNLSFGTTLYSIEQFCRYKSLSYLFMRTYLQEYIKSK